MKWCLYRDLPFRPLFANGIGFQQPKQDECRGLWFFSSETRAATLRKTLRFDAGGLVHIAKAARIRERIKTEWTT